MKLWVGFKAGTGSSVRYVSRDNCWMSWCPMCNYFCWEGKPKVCWKIPCVHTDRQGWMSLPAQRATVHSLGWTPSHLPTAHLCVVLFKGVRLCGVLLNLLSSCSLHSFCRILSSSFLCSYSYYTGDNDYLISWTWRDYFQFLHVTFLPLNLFLLHSLLKAVGASGHSEGRGRWWIWLDLDSVLDCLMAASSCGVVICTSSSELLAKASVAFLKW